MTHADIAIIGAGMAGLSAAEHLVAPGRRVMLFDKGRRPSGRLASRLVDAGDHRFAFDYGAQYMTARDPGFRARLDRWAKDGVAAPWPAAGDDAWVGVPAMDAPLAAMAAAVQVEWSAHVRAVERDGAGWHLCFDDAWRGPFGHVVLAMPAEQVADMAASVDPALAALAMAHPSAPCWTAMLGFDRPVDAPALLDGDGVIDRAVRNAAKPGRGAGEGWTLHADADWSARHIEDDRAAVAHALTRALAARIPGLPMPVHAAAHRWRYARSGAAGIGSYRNAALGLSACGDWLLAPRVESAWLSGLRAAEAMLADG